MGLGPDWRAATKSGSDPERQAGGWLMQRHWARTGVGAREALRRYSL